MLSNQTELNWNMEYYGGDYFVMKNDYWNDVSSTEYLPANCNFK